MFDIKMMKTAVAILALTLTVSTQAQADSKLVGSWVKHHTQQEDHVYPGDTNWNLEVTFQADGTFVWHSTRLEGDTTIDESISGTYSVNRGMITFMFDKPSNAAHKRLSGWFAFWPKKLQGQQTFRFENEFLVLGHDGNKLWFYLKRKDVEQDKSSLHGDPRR